MIMSDQLLSFSLLFLKQKTCRIFSVIIIPFQKTWNCIVLGLFFFLEIFHCRNPHFFKISNAPDVYLLETEPQRQLLSFIILFHPEEPHPEAELGAAFFV